MAINFDDSFENIEDFFTEAKQRAIKNINKKSSKKKGFVPKEPSSRNESQEAQRNVLSKSHIKKDKEEKVESFSGVTYLLRHSRSFRDNFIKTNKRTKYVNQRIEILKAEVKKYVKLHDEESINLIKDELKSLQNEQNITTNALRKITAADVAAGYVEKDEAEIIERLEHEKENLKKLEAESADFSKIHEAREKIEDIKNELADAENHNIQLKEKEALEIAEKELKDKKLMLDLTPIKEILKGIKTDLKNYDKESDDIENLEDYIDSGKKLDQEIISKYLSDNNFTEEDLEESEYIQSISTIATLPIFERIEALAKLIRSMIPANVNVTWNDIYIIIRDGKQTDVIKIIEKYKRIDEIKQINKELAEIKKQKNIVANRLKKRENVVDFVVDYLKYDESNDDEKYVAKSILINSSLDWANKIVQNVMFKNNINGDLELQSELFAQAAYIITEYAEKWFGEREKGEEQEWFYFIYSAVKQGIIKHLSYLKNHGTISGTNAMTVDHKRKKTYNRILSNLKVDPKYKHFFNKNNEIDETLDAYVWFLVDKEEANKLMIETASATESRIGGGGEDAEKVDIGNFISDTEKDELSRSEATLLHEQLIKNMADLFRVLNPKNNKERLFDDLDILIIKLQLGLLYNKQTGKKYKEKECVYILNQWIKENNYKGLRTPTKLFGPIPGVGLEPEPMKGTEEWKIWDRTQRNPATSMFNKRKTALFGNRIRFEADKHRHDLWENGIIGGEEPHIRELDEGKFYKLINSNEKLKQAFSELTELIGNKFMLELQSSEEEILDEIDNAIMVTDNKNNQENFKKYVNLDIALGSDELSDIEDFASAYNEMIDFTGLNL